MKVTVSNILPQRPHNVTPRTPSEIRYPISDEARSFPILARHGFIVRAPGFTLPLLCVALLLGLAGAGSAQPVTLTIKSTNSQVAVSWPNGLGLVQPQKRTNLIGGAWQDFGTATSSTNLADISAAGRAFYRLRFLAPSITTQPQGQSIAVGGNATFNVTANGTLPLTYQWRKGGTNLAGQTTAALGLTNATAGIAGDYSVLIANSVGAATSVVAVLTISVPFGPPRGIYSGKFTGQTNNAGFVLMARTNGQMVALMDSAPLGGSLSVTNIPISGTGTFSVAPAPGVLFSGAFAGDAVSGFLVSTNGSTNSFSGTHKLDTGIHQADAGYYDGTFTGLLTGRVSSILAGDGTTFNFLAAPNLGSGGSFGMIDAANNFSGVSSFTLPGTTTPAMIQITGKLDSTTHVFSGTYGLGAISLGTFSLSRVSTP
jgi:hypothetical protein